MNANGATPYLIARDDNSWATASYKRLGGAKAESAIITKDSISPEEMRGKIMALEAAMLAMPEHQIEIKTTHHFAPGVYMREVFIPKGTTLTGKIHKTEHLNILSQGELSVWTENGVKKLKASTVVKSHPGAKRVGYAHEDSVWITVHANPSNEPSVEKLEEMFIAKTFEEALAFAEQKQIEGGK